MLITVPPTTMGKSTPSQLVVKTNFRDENFSYDHEGKLALSPKLTEAVNRARAAKLIDTAYVNMGCGSGC